MDPGVKARRRDRKQAMRMVRDAWKRGQITGLDRDRRLRELDGARTMGAVETHVRDLRTPAPGGPAVPPAALPAQATPPAQTVPAPPGAPGPANNFGYTRQPRNGLQVVGILLAVGLLVMVGLTVLSVIFVTLIASGT